MYEVVTIEGHTFMHWDYYSTWDAANKARKELLLDPDLTDAYILEVSLSD